MNQLQGFQPLLTDEEVEEQRRLQRLAERSQDEQLALEQEWNEAEDRWLRRVWEELRKP